VTVLNWLDCHRERQRLENFPPPIVVKIRNSKNHLIYELLLLGHFSKGPMHELAPRKVFFSALRENGLAQQLIYVPGNHDFDIWHVVEHWSTSSTSSSKASCPVRSTVRPRRDRRSPAGPRRQVSSPQRDGKARTARQPNQIWQLLPRPRHATAVGPRAEGYKSTFNFAYPNLYVVTSDGASVLLTHGHYFETY
jgi:hypothetical protein